MLVPVDGGGGALPEGDFDKIEEAVRETRRGRWFLDEFAKRRDASGTRTILDALARLERHFIDQQSRLPSPEIVKLSSLIAKARSEIAAAGKSLPDAPELPDDIRLYERLAEQARDAARLAIRGHDELQEARRSLTASGSAPDTGDAIGRSVEDLRKLASSQDVLAARLARAMSLMADIDSHLSKYETPEPTLEDGPLAPDSRKYFSAGEALFVPVSDPPKPAQAAEPAKPAEASSPPRPKIIAAAPSAEMAAPVARGAKLTVRHTAARDPIPEAAMATAAASIPEAAAPSAPADAPARTDAAEKRRIFIVRRPASEAIDIPLADDQALGSSAA